jgi:hypothetical protein
MLEQMKEEKKHGKNNISEHRFSDELANLIDRQVGDTFTQKFENLITRCVLWELPKQEKRLEAGPGGIRQEQQRGSMISQKATEQLRHAGG